MSRGMKIGIPGSRVGSMVLCIALVVGTSACKRDALEQEEAQYDGTPYVLEYGQFPPPPIAADNPLTVQGVKLGRALFYETDLSLDGNMSCASCHRQEHAFSDTARFSIGVHGLPGKRQAMACSTWRGTRIISSGMVERICCATKP